MEGSYLVGENWPLFWWTATSPLHSVTLVKDSLDGKTTHCTLLYYYSK